MRDEFPASVKEELARRVAYLCSNPACRQPTSGPQASTTGTINIGVAAHIAAASIGGPRYNETQTTEERAATDNGIWLCQNCAKLVDSDENRYTVEKLQEWKQDAEAAAAMAIEHRRAPVTESEGVFFEAQRIMPDLIRELREAVKSDETQLVREFVILPSKGVTFLSDRPRFAVNETDNPNIRLQMDWLEEMGLVRDVTPHNAPIYRLVSEFAEWLRAT